MEENAPRGKVWVIVGLGNPGKEYAQTRHNMGWMVVEELANRHGWTFKDEKRFNAHVAKGLLGTSEVHLLLPTTYMNLSGHALAKYLSYYKLSTGGVIVAVDDVALDFGEVRIRTFGSAGGHNGLKSIESILGTRHYIRLRLGIGSHLENKRVLTDYVLDAFSKEEGALLPETVKQSAQVLQRLLQEKVEQVMNQVNTKKKKIDRPPNKGQENKNESK